MPDVIGGRYRVRSTIGQGGMGSVWLAHDERLSRDVAVKQVGLLPGESATDSARALREARSSAGLGHPNVVTVFDVVQEGEAIWLVMEYVEGRSLSQLVRDEGPLPPDRVAAIGAEVADALATAHAHGTVHRDVKPGNILVREDGTAKISDFGIARTQGDPTVTQSGMLTGTPMYFAPELASGGDPSPASDVWALGASLYAAVEGRAPYPPTTNPVAMLSRIASERPAPPKHAGPLEPALLRMLDRDPRSRWSMADAAHRLHQIGNDSAERTVAATAAEAQADPGADTRAGGAAVATPPVAPAAAGPATPGPRKRSRRLPWYVALVLLALVLLGGAGWALLDGEDARTPTGPPEHERSPAASGEQSPTSPSPSPSDASPSAPSSAPSPEPSSTTRPEESGAGPVRFLSNYYATAPTDTDAGWASMGPDAKARIGRDSYDQFWDGIESVETRGFKVVDADTVLVTLTYHFDDGSAAVERQRIALVRGEDGSLLINGDEVLSHKSVSS